MDRRVKLVSVEGIQKRKTPDKNYVSISNRLVSKSPSERQNALILFSMKTEFSIRF